MYDQEPRATLNTMRASIFARTIVRKQTSHNFQRCVYSTYQAAIWKAAGTSPPPAYLSPLDCGWDLPGTTLQLTQRVSGQRQAPKEILDSDICCCKTGCSTAHCTCKKRLLTCTVFCKCKGDATSRNLMTVRVQT